MSFNQMSGNERPRALGLTRAMLLVGAFLTGLFLSESFGDEEKNDEAHAPPVLQQPLARVDR